MNLPDREEAPDQTGRLCDFCSESKALLYCPADSAKLCLTCDRDVHSTNQLFQKHVRSLLCNSCGSSPSAIFCRTESAVLCQNCDWETHRGFGCIHDRRPIEGFNGCPSVSELVNFLGLDDLGKKAAGQEDDEVWDFLVWDTPALRDLIVPGDFGDDGGGFQAMGVPPLPKNRNSICGKNKEEIFSQIREMARKDPNFSGSLEDLQLMDNNSSDLENKAEPVSVPSYEANTPNWSCYTSGFVRDESFPSTVHSSFVEMNHLVVPDSDNVESTSAIGHGPMGSKANQVLLVPKVGCRELNSQERGSAISRYREKRKNRRYEKHIRYESRKARAETRTRIKGRFAKMDQSM